MKTRGQSFTNGKDSLSNIAKTIHEEFGLRGFWRGSIPRILRVAPGQGIMFLAYESIMKYLENKK